MKTNTIYLTDGGLETELIFHHGIDLPHFASFPLLTKPQYRNIMSDYYRRYMNLAKKYVTGFILESATWRANKDWGYKLGYSEKELTEVNRLAIKQLRKLKDEYDNQVESILVSGQIGPASDGYNISRKMTVAEARDYHNHQVSVFKEEEVDIVSALTINYMEEGLGIVESARYNDLPVVISFTVETDGRLPSGDSLQSAIEKTDKASNNYPLYYMINCAHPSHFSEQITGKLKWQERIGGVRANASCMSHAELDESETLDAGDKAALSDWYGTLQQQLPNLRVYGGCCGTDVSHIEAVCKKII